MKQLAVVLLMKIVVNSLLFLTDQSTFKLAYFKCAAVSAENDLSHTNKTLCPDTDMPYP